MAQAPRQSDGGADFIRQIVSDPKNVPDVMMLIGYLGDSSEEGHERLYLSRDLTNYVEIPKAAILHQAPLPKEQDAYGGVTVWVKKDARYNTRWRPPRKRSPIILRARFRLERRPRRSPLRSPQCPR